MTNQKNKKKKAVGESKFQRRLKEQQLTTTSCMLFLFSLQKLSGTSIALNSLHLRQFCIFLDSTLVFPSTINNQKVETCAIIGGTFLLILPWQAHPLRFIERSTLKGEKVIEQQCFVLCAQNGIENRFDLFRLLFLALRQIAIFITSLEISPFHT